MSINTLLPAHVSRVWQVASYKKSFLFQGRKQRTRKLVVCIIVRCSLAAQLQYSSFAQHHFLAFPWHCKTTICISISHSHRCLLQIGPSICQQVRITMIKNFKQDRPGVRGSCQENGMMSFCLAKYVYEDGEKCLLCFHCHREWRLEF